MPDELRDNLEVVWGALVALVVVVLLTPAVGGMARLLGVVDRPRRRRPTGRAAARRDRALPRDLRAGARVPRRSAARCAGSCSARRSRPPSARSTTSAACRWWEKLGGQVVAASIPVLFGVWIHSFTFPFVGVHELPAWVGMPLTVVGIVAVMNMVNFLDGLDGLAAGVCAISGFSFCVIELSLGKPDAAILTAIVFGACLGFLRHNFYPARIFMGDSGALLLGFILAAVAVQGMLKTAATSRSFLPLLVLAVPLLDTSFVVARRIKHGQPVYAPTRRTCTTASWPSASRSAARRYLCVWCRRSRGRARDAVRPVREDGEWHLWETLAVGAVGLVALAASIYIVYLLEIVKLANPFIRRREEAARRERRSGVSTHSSSAWAGRVGGGGARLERRVDRASRPGDGALGVELALEHVADRVERRRGARRRRGASGTVRRRSSRERARDHAAATRWKRSRRATARARAGAVMASSNAERRRARKARRTRRASGALRRGLAEELDAARWRGGRAGGRGAAGDASVAGGSIDASASAAPAAVRPRAARATPP